MKKLWILVPLLLLLTACAPTGAASSSQGRWRRWSWKGSASASPTRGRDATVNAQIARSRLLLAIFIGSHRRFNRGRPP